MKRQAHDQAFDSRTSWKLVYPDGQLAMNLPGLQEEEFTLRNYKEDLGNPYNRITLYLCPEEPEDEFMLDSETETEPDLRVLGKILSHSQLFMPLSFLSPTNKRRERKLYERGNEISFYLDTSLIMERQKIYPSSICSFRSFKLTLFQFTILLSSL